MEKVKREALLNRFNEIGTIHNRAKADVDLIDEEARKIPFIIVSNSSLLLIDAYYYYVRVFYMSRNVV